jgi:predicted amidohydrolase
MKLCVAQIRPVKGDIEANIDRHKQLLDLAAAHGADVVIFPELSITGYEPELANALAIDTQDARLDDFQQISDAKRMTIGVGVPTRNPAGISITLVLFQPHAARQTYAKRYLHPDEEPFFVSGSGTIDTLRGEHTIALAICYELSVPDHAADASRREADVYIASVAKSADGVPKAAQKLTEIARQYAMTVMMANCVGPCDTFQSAGQSAIWDEEGALLGQLDDSHEGILVIDTSTRTTIANVM